MRRISSYDADACASAKDKECDCRCNGALHGRSHKELIKFEDSLLAKGEELTVAKDLSFIKNKLKINLQ